MAKAYWISTYRAINDPDKMAAYAALAKPDAPERRRDVHRARHARGGYELGANERVTLIEWDSVEQAIAAHDGEASGGAGRARRRGRARHRMSRVV